MYDCSHCCVTFGQPFAAGHKNCGIRASFEHSIHKFKRIISQFPQQSYPLEMHHYVSFEHLKYEKRAQGHCFRTSKLFLLGNYSKHITVRITDPRCASQLKYVSWFLFLGLRIDDPKSVGFLNVCPRDLRPARQS